MDPTTLAHFKALLESLKADLLSEGDLTIERKEQEAFDRADPDDDIPLAEMNQVIASRRNQVRTGSLLQIQAALNRIATAPDDFGYCVICDDPIPHKRLELMPYVTMCVKCQSEQEDDPRLGRRKHLRDFS